MTVIRFRENPPSDLLSRTPRRVASVRFILGISAMIRLGLDAYRWTYFGWEGPWHHTLTYFSAFALAMTALMAKRRPTTCAGVAAFIQVLLLAEFNALFREFIGVWWKFEAVPTILVGLALVLSLRSRTAT